MLTMHQHNTLNDLIKSVQYFKTHDLRDDITFTQVLDQAGVEYSVFYSVVQMLRKRNQIAPLRRLAQSLREIDVLKKVSTLANLPEEDDSEPREPLPTPMRATVDDSVPGDAIDAQLHATIAIVQALKPMSQRQRECVLMSVQGMYKIGMV